MHYEFSKFLDVIIGRLNVIASDSEYKLILGVANDMYDIRVESFCTFIRSEYLDIISTLCELVVERDPFKLERTIIRIEYLQTMLSRSI